MKAIAVINDRSVVMCLRRSNTIQWNESVLLISCSLHYIFRSEEFILVALENASH